MPAVLAAVTKLVFSDGWLSIESMEPPNVIPADPLEYPPTKFLYTGENEVTLRIVASQLRFAERMFLNGGPYACAIERGQVETLRGLTFHPVGMQVNYEWGNTSGSMTGILRGATQAGALVPAEHNARYTAMYAPRELTPEELAACVFWNNDSWDW